MTTSFPGVIRHYISLWNDGSDDDSFEAALAAAATVAALHPIVSVEIFYKVIESALTDAIFDCLPSAAYAQHVNPYGISQAAVTKTDIEEFIARLPRLESAEFDRIPADFD